MPAKVAFPDFSANRTRGLAPTFACAVRDDGIGPTWVQVVGDLDINTTPRLEQALDLTAARRLVILDLRGVSFLDSCGVHAICDASARARQANRWFVLTRGCSQVNRILALSGASDRLTIIDLPEPEPEPPKQASPLVSVERTAWSERAQVAGSEAQPRPGE